MTNDTQTPPTPATGPDEPGKRPRRLSSVPLFTQPPHPSPPARARATRGALPPRPGEPLPEPPLPPLPAHLVEAVEAVEVDWSLVARLRQRASEQIARAEHADGTPSDRADQKQRGLAIVIDLVTSANTERVDAGSPAWEPAHLHALTKAVRDSLFGLGRLQPLVDRPDVENIEIAGHDHVRLQLLDGSYEAGPPVADSDEELVDFLVFLASRSETSARSFSPAQPNLDLRLDGGARLAATAWVSTRPQVTIRLHRLVDVTLDDLAANGTLTDVQASFLRAAVRARKSIVVSGAQGAGKTTLMRALCGEIPYEESIGTFETEYELFLHEMPDRHAMVRHFEARPGAGEVGPDGRPAGEYSIDQLLRNSYRQNLSRQIVGEVRGAEVWAMLEAMESGSGSLSTTHATDAENAIHKLVTCAMKAGPGITPDLATRKLAQAIDLIVHVDLDLTVGTGAGAGAAGQARPRRTVSEIIAVNRGEQAPGYAVTHVFRSDGAGPGLPHVLPQEYRALARYGFDLDAFLRAGRGEVA
ncbi:CpaF family protein [Xylanimonas protaetiae]|uniref:CpaF family protein n=1 Tax=Xylanimonas protaetiae TaxID=2509457 RepID=A0A4V0YFS8_9MICO|nr:CpaF/VirB11 family protein [Xylanimonas protaetiae]QAY68761.1 CpaF family protein [Xylanimonas protaetiae]